MEPTTVIQLDPKAIPAALAQYSVTQQVLDQVRQLRQFKITDKPSYDVAVGQAKNLKNLRSKIEAKRVELKAPALEFGKAVDAEAKRLTAEIEPSERHLLAEIKRVDDIEAARKAELHKTRSAQLQQAGFLFDGRFWMAGLFSLEAAKLADLTDEQFNDQFEQGVKYLEGERARKEAEERRRREEDERLAKEREQLAAEKAALDAKLKRLAELEAKEQQAPAAPVAPVINNGEPLRAGFSAPADPFAGLRGVPTHRTLDAVGKILGPESPAVGKATIAPAWPAAPASDFAAGYEQAKADILAEFRNLEIRRTREQWIEFIANLKPAIF